MSEALGRQLEPTVLRGFVARMVHVYYIQNIQCGWILLLLAHALMGTR